MASLEELVRLARAAADEAAGYQEKFAAEDVEARKIVDVMEQFLRDKGRVVYGGAAINAHMSDENKFYDPRLYLPDYDFLTPDPLQDCADLIVAFQSEGFMDVEAKFGIHEGTYKIFVNYRAAADITFMPVDIYRRIVADAVLIDGIRYASVNYLRMNIYLELSRPAGMVSRWEKVYKRLLLLNEEHPMRHGPGSCGTHPLTGGGGGRRNPFHDRLIGAGISADAVFLSGLAYLEGGGVDDIQAEVVLMISAEREALVKQLVETHGLVAEEFVALGELLPARTELRVDSKNKNKEAGQLVGVVFDTVACHNYVELAEPPGYRLGSLDLLIQMYYALYFADVRGYTRSRLLCIIQRLVEMEHERRTMAVESGVPVAEVFPLRCIGHQPTMPELKRAHRERVKEKKAVLAALQTRSRRPQPPAKVKKTRKRGYKTK